MNTTALVLRAGLRDLSRNRWIVAYAAAFFLIPEGLFWFGGTGPQVVLSLLNVVLLVVPLVALIFGTIHVYASREFVELLLAQPVRRSRLDGVASAPGTDVGHSAQLRHGHVPLSVRCSRRAGHDRDRQGRREKVLSGLRSDSANAPVRPVAADSLAPSRAGFRPASIRRRPTFRRVSRSAGHPSPATW